LADLPSEPVAATGRKGNGSDCPDSVHHLPNKPAVFKPPGSPAKITLVAETLLAQWFPALTRLGALSDGILFAHWAAKYGACW